MEHSERGREVTEQVALWIENDGQRIDKARDLYGDGRDFELRAMVTYLRMQLQTALRSSAPWQVAQDLSPRDYDRIDWAIVAERIKAQS